MKMSSSKKSSSKKTKCPSKCKREITVECSELIQEEKKKCCDKQIHFVENITQGDANIAIEVDDCKQPYQRVTTTVEGQNTCITIEIIGECHREKITVCTPTGGSGSSGLCTQCPPPFDCIGNRNLVQSGFVPTYTFSSGVSFNSGPSGISAPTGVGTSGVTGATSAYFIAPIVNGGQQVGIYYQIPITIPSGGIQGSSTILSVTFPQGISATQLICESSIAGYNMSSIGNSTMQLITNIINGRITVSVPSTQVLSGVPFPNNLVSGRLQTFVIISVGFATNGVTGVTNMPLNMNNVQGSSGTVCNVCPKPLFKNTIKTSCLPCQRQ